MVTEENLIEGYNRVCFIACVCVRAHVCMLDETNM